MSRLIQRTTTDRFYRPAWTLKSVPRSLRGPLANGNRTNTVLAGTHYLTPVSTTSNRLLSAQRPTSSGIVTEAVVHDAAGNITAHGSALPGAVYSDRGRRASATVAVAAGSTVTVKYAYNALEQRTAKYGPGSVVPTGFVFYAYDEAGHLLGEYDINGVPFYEAIWLGDLPLAVIKQTRTGSGTTLNVVTRVDYIYADHLETPRVIVRSGDHVLIWRWDNSADPFGAVPPSDNPNGLGV
jgi:hypothetical protein